VATWQEAYRDAVQEVDDDKLKVKLEAAETAIYLRLQELAGSSNHFDERARIGETLRGIRGLQVERLHFPAFPKEGK